MKILRIIRLNCLVTILDGYLILEEGHNFQARIRLMFETNLADLRTNPLEMEWVMELVVISRI